MTADELRICAVPDVSCISVTGRDATRFLQAQLSQDITSLPDDRAALAAWHDARGRVRAVFRVLRQGPGWWLITESSIAGPASDAMRRFVLRADATLSRLDDWSAYALIGRSREWLAEHEVHLDDAAGALHRRDSACWLRIGPKLVHCFGSTQATAAVRERCNAGPELATRAEIFLGLPSVDAQTTGTYVPQMLNLDRLGAIAFDKGCFPGQEIIARTRNLGAVKRRARIFSSPATGIAVGDRILNAAGKPVGEVLRVAKREAGSDLMAVVQLAELHGPLHVDDAGGSALTELPAPPSSTDAGT